MKCPQCGKTLDPTCHGDLVCDGQVFCDSCRRYDRRLLELLPLKDIAGWHRHLCQAFGCKPPSLALGEPPLPAGPFDFLNDKKFLMAEADHREGVIVLYPSGLRLATLCHELAHLMTGQGHTEDWARTFAKLVFWVKSQLPPDHFITGMRVNLLKPPEN